MMESLLQLVTVADIAKLFACLTPTTTFRLAISYHCHQHRLARRGQ
ncbi:hypothetical protein DSUL_80017 [Desulfovibrionales bacterium]